MEDTMTIEQLAEMMQNTMASKEDLQPLATKGALHGLRGTMQDMAEEMNAMHADVRYIRSTVDKLVHSDIAHDVAIEDLTARVHRLEQKAGLTQ